MKYVLLFTLLSVLTSCDAGKKKPKDAVKKKKEEMSEKMEGMSKSMQAKVKKHCSGIEDKKAMKGCMKKIKEEASDMEE